LKKKIFSIILIFTLLIFFIFCIFSIFKWKTGTKSNPIEEYTIHLENETDTDSTFQIVSAKIDSLFQIVHQSSGFNGSILVAKNDCILIHKDYGYADFKTKTALNHNSIYQLASVSKQFTAVAILILYENGQLALDDSVSGYIPDFPYENITIRQLLHHTSGLPIYFWLAEHKWKGKNPPLNAEMLELMKDHNLPLFNYPGRKFDYSNTGYFILAAIVEKISGMTFNDFLTTYIFKPLNMTNSFVYRYKHDSIRINQLEGYRKYKRRWHIVIPGTVNDAVVGDKNVYSTTEDLYKWITGLNSGKIISKKTLHLMYTVGKTSREREIPYGFGVRIKQNSSGKVVYHNGKWNGFNSSLKHYLHENLVIILLEHSSYNYPNYLTQKVRSIVNEYIGNNASQGINMYETQDLSDFVWLFYTKNHKFNDLLLLKPETNYFFIENVDTFVDSN